jgi:hypothetical protein
MGNLGQVGERDFSNHSFRLFFVGHGGTPISGKNWEEHSYASPLPSGSGAGYNSP